MIKKHFYPLILSICLMAVAPYCRAQQDYTSDPDVIEAKLMKVASWQIEHPRHQQTDWTNGAFYAGLFAAWEVTAAPFIYDAMMAMGNDSNQWRPGRRWYHADDIAICQTYIDLYRQEENDDMLKPTIDTIDYLMANPYPVKGIEVIKWWWCDALFMAPPALVKLASVTGNDAYLTYNDACFLECYNLLYNKDEHLFARDLNYIIKNDDKDRREANGQPVFWSRGNGWVMAGLARVLAELPGSYPQFPFYRQLFNEMAERVISLQQEDGLWRASLLDPESYPGGEVSGSGFFCYALMWGINNGFLDEETYFPAVEKAWKALNTCVNDEGRVGWVQPIGADPRKNFNEDSWEVYGTGAFLLAGSEVIKYYRQ